MRGGQVKNERSPSKKEKRALKLEDPPRKIAPPLDGHQPPPPGAVVVNPHRRQLHRQDRRQHHRQLRRQLRRPHRRQHHPDDLHC